MKRTLLMLTVATLLLSACAKKALPVESNSSNNPEIRVDTLFTKDGCTMYRFYDAGYYRYYVRCTGAVSSSTLWNETCGKACSREVAIPTGYVGIDTP